MDRATGSSPLTRGKQTGRDETPDSSGLIPAHAGKTVWLGAAWLERGAHPRSRGENSVSASSCLWSAGSSPLTRGKLRLRIADDLPLRLIPAHAGKTAYTFLAVCTCGAHPRSRGENPTGVSGLRDM